MGGFKMDKVTVTLMERSGNATVTVTVRKLGSKPMYLVHQELLKKYPGYYVRKSTIGR